MPRRSSLEVDELIMKAATELFLERGYRSATTREIAERAGVAEPLLFRRHDNKSGLFVACTVSPLRAKVAEFSSKWSAGAGRKADLDAFAGALLELLRSQCAALLAVSAAIAHERAEMEAAGVLEGVEEVITRLVATAETRVEGGPGKTERARVLVGAIWSAAQHGEFLVPRRREKAWIRVLVAGLARNR